ncbi:hypothetical protein ACFYT3_13795 [Nocardia amikacinitolerans]|uniref:hypothetical protein n=1 Tax=Nocardia amikacinitolerans TaxID=756689 RepID=UPI003698F202
MGDRHRDRTDAAERADRGLGVLGAGGMGRVLLGVGPDGRYVAIKQIHPHLVDDAEWPGEY